MEIFPSLQRQGWYDPIADELVSENEYARRYPWQYNQIASGKTERARPKSSSRIHSSLGVLLPDDNVGKTVPSPYQYQIQDHWSQSNRPAIATLNPRLQLAMEMGNPTTSKYSRTQKQKLLPYSYPRPEDPWNQNLPDPPPVSSTNELAVAETPGQRLIAPGKDYSVSDPWIQKEIYELPDSNFTLMSPTFNKYSTTLPRKRSLPAGSKVNTSFGADLAVQPIMRSENGFNKSSSSSNIAAIEQSLDPVNLTQSIPKAMTNTEGKIVQNPNLIQDPHRQGVSTEEVAALDELTDNDKEAYTPSSLSDPWLDPNPVDRSPSLANTSEVIETPFLDEAQMAEGMSRQVKNRQAQSNQARDSVNNILKKPVSTSTAPVNREVVKEVAQAEQALPEAHGKVGRVAKVLGLGALATVGTGAALSGLYYSQDPEGREELAQNAPYSWMNTPERQARLEMKKQESLIRKYNPTPEEAAELSLKVAKQKADLEQGYRQTERMRQLSAQLMQDRVSNYINSMAQSQALTSHLISSTLNV